MSSEDLRSRPVELQKKAEALGATTFLGVPVPNFELTGSEHFIYLLAAGLTPQSKLVDLGCGVLRLGYWLIHFLDPLCYCGIEPHPQRLAMGIDTILEAEVREFKRPRFHSTADFDTSVFGEKFDFFLAYSIWTHASKQQIRTMLDAFLRDSKDEAVFLTRYLPAGEGVRIIRARGGTERATSPMYRVASITTLAGSGPNASREVCWLASSARTGSTANPGLPSPARAPHGQDRFAHFLPIYGSGLAKAYGPGAIAGAATRAQPRDGGGSLCSAGLFGGRCHDQARDIRALARDDFSSNRHLALS
jgi:hypothetical protein